MTNTHIAENDIMSIRDTLRSILTHIDGILSLPATVRELQAQVNDLSADMKAAETSVAQMSEEIRSQAETIAGLYQERRQLTQEVVGLINIREELLKANTSLSVEHDRLVNDLAVSDRRRDDFEFHAMELEEELASTRAKLAMLQDAFDKVFPKQVTQGQVNPAPVPVYVEHTQAQPFPDIGEAVPSVPEPAPEVVASPQIGPSMAAMMKDEPDTTEADPTSGHRYPPFSYA